MRIELRVSRCEHGDGAIRAEHPEDAQSLPMSWSPDGRRIGGTLTGSNGQLLAGVLVHDLEAGTTRFLEFDFAVPASRHVFPVLCWLPDSRRGVVRWADRIVLIDTTTGAVATLATGFDRNGGTLRLSADRRWLYCSTRATRATSGWQPGTPGAAEPAGATGPGRTPVIGTKLDPTRSPPSGRGRMGEVYRATDTKLRRDVAIKVLPAAFTEDRERLARFEREAQLLAQLHHSNIASIFGLEESGGIRALVMELVEGPTLADRLSQGGLPLEESLAIARQIAERSSGAREGIVHRDLKPQTSRHRSTAP